MGGQPVGEGGNDAKRVSVGETGTGFRRKYSGRGLSAARQLRPLDIPKGLAAVISALRGSCVPSEPGSTVCRDSDDIELDGVRESDCVWWCENMEPWRLSAVGVRFLSLPPPIWINVTEKPSPSRR